ncbi:VCBS domain-containing protein [Rhizobium leguminosarum]|uniref:VCBS domain-containing protein n=1 Tax=Rhizobium leguminosarum TaxID=384 RepID=UPI001FED345B|nr:VCBS domain-containing protein [Rhizobium leguminosarum]UIY26232.1 VCBS domain-containing protein [Rhizobium leguminosarum]
MYGSFTFNAASGSWTYTLDNNRAATQALNQGDAVSDTLSVSSLDGTASHNIVVAITGANDAASIVVDATVTDDRATVEAGAAGSGDPNASGKLTVSDVDDGEAAFAAPASSTASMAASPSMPPAAAGPIRSTITGPRRRRSTRATPSATR